MNVDTITFRTNECMHFSFWYLLICAENECTFLGRKMGPGVQALVGGRGQGILIPRVLKYYAKCDDIDSRSKGMDMQPWGAFGFYGRGHENLWIPLQCMESKNRVLLGCLFYGFVWGINKKRVGRKNAVGGSQPGS